MANILDDSYFLVNKQKKEFMLFGHNIGIAFHYHFEIKNAPLIDSIAIIPKHKFHVKFAHMVKYSQYIIKAN